MIADRYDYTCITISSLSDIQINGNIMPLRANPQALYGEDFAFMYEALLRYKYKPWSSVKTTISNEISTQTNPNLGLRNNYHIHAVAQYEPATIVTQLQDTRPAYRTQDNTVSWLSSYPEQEYFSTDTYESRDFYLQHTFDFLSADSFDSQMSSFDDRVLRQSNIQKLFDDVDKFDYVSIGIENDWTLKWRQQKYWPSADVDMHVVKGQGVRIEHLGDVGYTSGSWRSWSEDDQDPYHKDHNDVYSYTAYQRSTDYQIDISSDNLEPVGELWALFNVLYVKSIHKEDTIQKRFNVLMKICDGGPQYNFTINQDIIQQVAVACDIELESMPIPDDSSSGNSLIFHIDGFECLFLVGRKNDETKWE